MEKKTGIIKWILKQPEGKQFLAGCLFTIVFLVGWLMYVYGQLNTCQSSRVTEVQEDKNKYRDLILKEKENTDRMKNDVDTIDINTKAMKKLILNKRK